ncbi:UDP-glucose 4-epimerase [plant metagenome]|uniref:UDP-glucose 4-epimerase n=1 Tax=plant metagenome TaxID=1297885 RepID=A0A484SPA8_9ZZZZ
MKVLVTGVTGFVGKETVRALIAKGHTVHGAVRREGVDMPACEAMHVVGDIGAMTDWRAALQGVDAVVHLAARAHVLNESHDSPLTLFRAVNTQGTLALARHCLDAGVKRFVFVSSIGVNGAHTETAPFRETDVPNPAADYALSKLEAETALKDLLAGSSMTLVIVRPPLVYAGNAPGNFRRLLGLVDSGIPLPFASIDNRRSMVALENLADFLTVCVSHSQAANQLFLIADGTDVSLPQILRSLAEGMNKAPRLLPFPGALLSLGASMVGKAALYRQLCGSLIVDASHARSLLGWQPIIGTEEALRRAGRDFFAQKPMR